MTIHQLLYLTQLENYDSNRVRAWLKKNPNRIVREKKQYLQWTVKARILFLLANILSLFSSHEEALFTALYLFASIDDMLKNFVYIFAWLAMRVLHPKMRVIGICGSWGKTTIKMSLAETLSSTYRVVTTKGNVNTIMGVALSVLRLPLNTEIFICEMDAFYRGEIATVCRLIQPEVGVVTAVGPMHLERFHDDVNALVRAQFELPEHVKKQGISFVPSGVNIPHELNSLSLRTCTSTDEVVRGVAQYFRINSTHTNMAQIEHRNEVQHINGMTIIDDAYNSNPVGFRRALQTLKDVKATSRILVTPGMIELGAVQEKENSEAAQEAAKVCDVVIIVGETNKNALMNGAKMAKKLVWVPDLEAAQEQLKVLAKPGAAVLFENDLTDQYF